MAYAPRPHLASSSFALVAAAGVWTACGTASSPSSYEVEAGALATTTVSSTSSGSGGTVIHDVGEGGNGTPAPPYAGLCGSGCKPDTGVATPCELSGDGGGGSSGGTCRLAADDEGAVSGTCQPVGTGADGEPCLADDDCAAGFGCVDPGVCRAYCCGAPEACPSGTHCAPRKLALVPPGVPVGPVDIPACAPIEPCTLLDDTTCSLLGETCTVVRLDGSTSCVPPGVGTAGEACPCAAGHVCSQGDARCWKLCRTNRSDDCPAGSQCSGGSKAYPAGFGVCMDL